MRTFAAAVAAFLLVGCGSGDSSNIPGAGMPKSDTAPPGIPAVGGPGGGQATLLPTDPAKVAQPPAVTKFDSPLIPQPDTLQPGAGANPPRVIMGKSPDGKTSRAIIAK